MKKAAKWARVGNRMISMIGVFMVALMFLYAGYSLWDNWRINHQAFASDDLQYKPDGEDNASLQELMAENPDVFGWLTVDDTHIDYPVVQGKDDMEYINKDIHGDFALSGAIFLSCLNDRGLNDSYSLVYGHHMANGAMFGDVLEFVEKEYFDLHQTGRFYLLNETREITLFACVKTDASDSLIYNPETSEGNTAPLLKHIKEKSVQYRDIGITEDDQLIALSTCAEATTNGRVIVFGRLEDAVQTQNGGVSNKQTE